MVFYIFCSILSIIKHHFYNNIFIIIIKVLIYICFLAYVYLSIYYARARVCVCVITITRCTKTYTYINQYVLILTFILPSRFVLSWTSNFRMRSLSLNYKSIKNSGLVNNIHNRTLILITIISVNTAVYNNCTLIFNYQKLVLQIFHGIT